MRGIKRTAAALEAFLFIKGNPVTMKEMEELKLVMEGLKDDEEGRIVDGPTAMAELRRKYAV